jgi:hypothetical protein
VFVADSGPVGVEPVVDAPQQTTAEGVHAMLSVVEQPASVAGEQELVVENGEQGPLTIPIVDVVAYLLEADRELTKEARQLDEHEGIPGMADDGDTKLEWGIRIGEVAGDRRRIRQSVERLIERLPQETQDKVRALMEEGSDV